MQRYTRVNLAKYYFSVKPFEAEEFRNISVDFSRPPFQRIICKGIYSFKMIKACVFLLLLAAYSIDCNVTSTCSQKEIASSYLDIAVDMISKAKYNIPTCDNCPKVSTKKPLDCADVLEMGHNKSGVYEIWPVNRVTGGKHLYVYCDMTTTGGGWTVIQRRGDFLKPIDYFYRDWMSYKDGFGEIEKDFWLGNDKIFSLTNQKLYSVRFDLKDFAENKRYAVYDNFWIADEDHKYTLQISDYTGDAGDSMAIHNNQSFSTKDKKNDRNTSGHCAQLRKGGWWYNNCYSVNLNGLYHKGKYNNEDGISWNAWKGSSESLAWTEIKIRPKNFRPSFT